MPQRYLQCQHGDIVGQVTVGMRMDLLPYGGRNLCRGPASCALHEVLQALLAKHGTVFLLGLRDAVRIEDQRITAGDRQLHLIVRRIRQNAE